MIRVHDASPAELECWDDTVARFPNCRVVHQRAWVRSLEDSGYGRPVFLLVERDDHVVAALPGLITRVGPLRLFGSPLPEGLVPRDYDGTDNEFFHDTTNRICCSRSSASVPP